MAQINNTAVKTAIILDTRRAKANNTYPVKLRLTFERKQKYYPTNIDLTIKEFERLHETGVRFNDKEKALKLKIASFETKAIHIVENLSIFTWDGFEKRYSANKLAKGVISAAYDETIANFKAKGQIGTAVSYDCAKNSLDKFIPNAKFLDITKDVLDNYESWMLSNGKSATTISIYLRTLRTLFNKAISDGDLNKEYYPFGKNRYEIPTGKNTKKALTLKEIALIYNYKPTSGTTADKAKDFWVFMYLCNGINIKDMCLLKYGNIDGDILKFVRAKTARTKKEVEEIRVVISDKVKSIIEKWGNKKKDANTYIFPIIKKGATPTRERQLIQQLTQVINSHMKTIAETLGIANDVTSYSARHSFATVLQRSGVSTSFISEALGHSSEQTTRNYLAGFEDGQKREAIKALTAFDID